MLPEPDGTALIGAAEAARQPLEAGDTAAARRHIEPVERFTKALELAGAIDAGAGYAVREAAARLLDAARG